MSQTQTVIDYIRKHPRCTRSQLIDIKSNGERIANITARITQARKKLSEQWETIKCFEEPSRKLLKGKRLRRTSYEIIKLPFKSIK